MKKILIFVLLFLIFGILISAPVLAQNNTIKTVTPISGNKLTNPLGADATPQIVIGRVIKAILGLVGSLALLMFVYGGITWMTSAGNEQNVAKGQKILMWATVGMIVVFSAYAIVVFVLKDVLGAS